MSSPALTPLRHVGRHMRVAVRTLALVLSTLALTGAALPAMAASETLADSPIGASYNVPGNLVFDLSVEFPTAISVAYTSRTYVAATSYLGYFDPNKCYTYYYTDGTSVNNYFVPAALASSHICSGQWSGNFLNWATMQTIDPFRWVLTGGYRVIDTATTTVIEKAWASTQGSAGSNFPDSTLASADVPGATPFASGTGAMTISIWGLGNQMQFAVPNSVGGGLPSIPVTAGTASVYTGGVPSKHKTYQLFVRAKVCDPTLGATYLEANCQAYGSNYKPEGLIQQYANKIRFSAFGYLNTNISCCASFMQGGVLRAQQKFVGPTQPVPGSTAITNAPGATTGQTTGAEWSAVDGTLITNPDAADATNTAILMGLSTGSITNSGVINYLNKFGEASQSYRTYDDVSILYYAAIRYLKNLSSVPEWNTVPTGNSVSTAVDGFPVITTSVGTLPDPILYSCQRNFILGIGDVHTWNDRNVPGNTDGTNQPTMPTSVSGDVSVNAVTRTNQIGVLETNNSITNWGSFNTLSSDSYQSKAIDSCCTGNSALMAGLAYDAHVLDIRGRTSLTTPQTVDTYWVDVQEGQYYQWENPFYLATKYGGFTVPTGYSITNTTPLPLASWHTNSTVDATTGQPYPDNYFSGGQPAAMQAGLIAAFNKIASTINQTTTSFSTALPQVAQTNNASFSSTYSATNWTGELTASILQFDPSTGNPTVVTPAEWTLSTNLATQLSGTGWSTNRRVVTWTGTAGAAFRASGTSQISSTELSALNTTYGGGSDAANYLAYLRGDRSNEVGVTGGTNSYRARSTLLGDIVGSQAVPVGVPSFPFSEAANPGYTAFKSTWSSRRTMVYFGSNDGMLHAVNGALLTTAPATPSTPALEVDALAGQEMFAYVPQALYQGPTATPGVNGLASLGNPSFIHHFMVNATPAVWDVDFGRVPTSSGAAQTLSPNWASVLIGGLGKGGKSYFAINVTDPVGMTTAGESTVAGKVLWEFTDPSLGYSYGLPLVTKTAKYGWVVILTSGYLNSDGQGYFIFVNPQTGALLEKVSTGVGSVGNDAGLAHANAFVLDATNGTADSVYAGDLQGNLWRLDLTPTSGAYSTPTKIASLTDSGGVPQPVTSDPVIEIDPLTKRRFVMVGTGRLLDVTDVNSTQQQTFYSIVDGTNAAFTKVPNSPLAYPYTRSVLSNDATYWSSGTTYNTASQAGWYQDLGLGPAGNGWRVISDPTTLNGSVAFAAVLPSSTDPCAPTGSSEVYGREFSSGQSTVQVSGSLAAYVPLSGTVTNLKYLSVAGKGALVAGTDTGTVTQINITPPTSFQLRRLNWRELQSVD